MHFLTPKSFLSCRRAFATCALAVSSAFSASISTSPTQPLVNDADLANYGEVSSTDKWWVSTGSEGFTRGQSFKTGPGALRLKSISYQTSTSSIPTKTFTIRVVKLSGNTITPVYSETATQSGNWTAGHYITWSFANPPILDGNTAYGVDVGMTSSTVTWQTGIPYMNLTANEFAGGARYTSGTGTAGIGSTTANYSTGDTIFHLDLENPLGGAFTFVAGSPPDNATAVIVGPEVVATFSRNLLAGSGNITIRNLTDLSDVTLPINHAAISVTQNLLKIQTAGLIDWNKNYAIRIDGGALLDDSSNAFPGIADDTTWNFSTAVSDPFLVAIEQLKTHINNSAPLDSTQIAQIFDTIIANKIRFPESTQTVSALFNLVATWDAAKGSSYLLNTGINFADRSTQAKTSDWTVYQVMQTIMDEIYTAPSLASHSAILNGYKFGVSAHFPGSCPQPLPGATHTVAINGSFPVTFGRITQQWTLPARKPTGTYLSPGTIATVTVPAALVNAGYKIRVGCHSWDLETRRTQVKRLDRATTLYPITSTTTSVASPYGGGIYIEVPYKANAGVVNVTINGAVRAPYFSLKSFHTTTPSEWLTERTHPAPWADFQTEKFMTQVPRKWVYNMTDPTAAMTAWDASMDAINSLMGFPLVRGKETMYGQADVIMRSSVHAPGYPAVNNITNPNSEVSPVGNAGNYLVRGPNGTSTTASHIEFHEQGHAYFFPKFGGESESNVNLLQPAMLNRVYGTSFDVAHRSSLGSNNTFRTIDNTAVAWMCVFNFSPREVPMASAESAYQHKGHAKWMDIARMYGWEKLDTFWRSYMEDEMNGLPVSESTDALLLRLCRSVGKDIRPLFHFWGIHPQNPSALAASIAAENIPADPTIKTRLLHYKTLIPANNAAFRTFALAWWGKQPSIGGAWEEREHARQWDTTALYGVGDQQRSQATNPGEIFNENSANDIINRVDELVELYFPTGMSPTTMSFTIAPTVVDASTITMTATTATAASPPVQYYFENITNNTNSGWITASTWQQTGLASDQNYSYRVKARDFFNTENNWSTAVAVSLSSAGDVSPPSPHPMTFAIVPTAVDEQSITMTATTAFDVNNVEYLFENITNSTNSGWQDSPVYTELNLLPLTSYTYRVRARDKSPNQNLTSFSANASTSTADLPDETAPELVSLSPTDDSLVTNLSTNIVVTFDEPIVAANGTITLKNLTDSSELEFDVNDPAVSIATNTLTLNPASNLVFDKNYAIQISSGAVADLSNNPFPGITDDNTWNFTAILGDPVANSGGPYVVPAGTTLLLNGSASAPSHLQSITLYEWDLNNDGIFGDVTGVTPSAISDAVLMGTWSMVVGQNTIALKVTDSSNKTATATTTVKLGASFVWDANGSATNQSDGSGSWIGSNQWWEASANYSWSSGANAIFGNGGAGGAVTLAAPTSINALTLNSFTGTYTIGSAGQAIALGSGITKNTGSGAATIISPITLGAAQSWTNNATTLLTAGPAPLSNGGNLLTVTGTGSTTISAAISGAGGLSKGGTGTLNLNAANSYLGTTTLSAGILSLGNDTSLGDGPLQINGGTIQSTNSSARTFSNAVTLGGNVAIGGSGNVSFSHTNTSALGASRTIDVTTSNVNATFAQAFTGTSLGITKTGAGILTLSGANSFTGGITLSGGKLIANGSTALGSGTIIMNTASTTLHLQRDSGLTVSNSWSFPTRNITHTVILDRQTSGSSGDWTLSSGLAQLSGNTMIFQKGANVTNTPTVILSTGMPTSDSNTGTIRVVGDTLNVRINNISNTRTRTIELSGSTFANEVYGAITQNNSFICSVTKTGIGTWLLSGNNNGTSVYSNGTTVSNGILNTTKAAALALYNSAGKVVINGGTLGVQLGGAGWTTGQVDALLSAATKTSGALGVDTTNGNLTQWAAFTTTNLGPSLGLTKMGTNSLTLSQSNTYAGPTKINSGTLIITGATQATSSIVMASNSSLGFVIGSPVSAPNAAVDFSNGNISITGAPSAATHVLLTASSFTGTPTLAAAIPGYELEIVGTQLLLKQTNNDPFATWAGAGQAFDADANNDGVANGMAWVLGAADPTVSSLSKLPTATQNAGDLVISFRCLNAASRGATPLHLQHSSTLGNAAAWTSIAVPEVSSMVGDVNFAITSDGNFLQITATIPATLANQGKIFARLSATP